MARRMFSDEITTSDAFLDMPAGSQLLYFHLGMNADDDGFIGSPKMVMRVLGSSSDEYKILIAKKFLIHFDDKGICVIKHWRINNQLRKDRYTPTKYLPEKRQLFVRKNGAYSLNKNEAIPVPDGHFLLEGDTLATSRQPMVALGKVSIGKVREEIVLPIWLNKKAWDAWVQYKKEKRKTLTPTTIKQQLKLLEENQKDHAQIIKNSITNGWTGLFPIKEDSKNNFKKASPRYQEPDTTKADNDRRNFLEGQSKSLAGKMTVN